MRGIEFILHFNHDEVLCREPPSIFLWYIGELYHHHHQYYYLYCNSTTQTVREYRPNVGGGSGREPITRQIHSFSSVLSSRLPPVQPLRLVLSTSHFATGPLTHSVYLYIHLCSSNPWIKLHCRGWATRLCALTRTLLILALLHLSLPFLSPTCVSFAFASTLLSLCVSMRLQLFPLHVLYFYLQRHSVSTLYSWTSIKHSFFSCLALTLY